MFLVWDEHWFLNFNGVVHWYSNMFDDWYWFHDVDLLIHWYFFDDWHMFDHGNFFDMVVVQGVNLVRDVDLYSGK